MNAPSGGGASDWATTAIIRASNIVNADLLARLAARHRAAASQPFIHISLPEEDPPMAVQDLPTTIEELRVQTGIGAARSGHVFDRTLLDPARGDGPMPPAVLELNLVAHFGAFYGFALVEALRIVAEHGNAELTDEVLHAVVDIGMNGDDGRCADVWPQIAAALAEGGVGTDAWDEQHLPGLVAFRNLVVQQREVLRTVLETNVAFAEQALADDADPRLARRALEQVRTSALAALAKLTSKAAGDVEAAKR